MTSIPPTRNVTDEQIVHMATELAELRVKVADAGAARLELLEERGVWRTKAAELAKRIEVLVTADVKTMDAMLETVKRIQQDQDQLRNWIQAHCVQREEIK